MIFSSDIRKNFLNLFFIDPIVYEWGIVRLRTEKKRYIISKKGNSLSRMRIEVREKRGKGI